MDRNSHQSPLQYIPESEGKFKDKVNNVILFIVALKNTHYLNPLCVIEVGIEFEIKKIPDIFLFCDYIPVRPTSLKKLNSNKYIFAK
jgi:hypothetical protein